MRRHYYGLVHGIFMLVALIMVPRVTFADRDNGGYLSEKVQEQERHIDNSDLIAKETKAELQLQISELRKFSEDDHSRIDRDEGIFIGADGLLGFLLAVGALKGFTRGKASNG